jgi:hypothetical protein
VWVRTPVLDTVRGLFGRLAGRAVSRIFCVPYDLQLTVLSNLMLMAAVAWPLFSTLRRRQRLTRDGQAMARTVPYTGPAVLIAAGLGLLVTAGLV